VGGLPTYYTAPDFSTIDKNRPLPAIFGQLGAYEMCCSEELGAQKHNHPFAQKHKVPQGAWDLGDRCRCQQIGSNGHGDG
jgi:hypothetical protein